MFELSEKMIHYRMQEIVLFTCDLRGSGVEVVTPEPKCWLS
jgi:hypothetical protein